MAPVYNGFVCFCIFFVLLEAMKRKRGFQDVLFLWLLFDKNKVFFSIISFFISVLIVCFVFSFTFSFIFSCIFTLIFSCLFLFSFDSFIVFSSKTIILWVFSTKFFLNLYKYH